MAKPICQSVAWLKRYKTVKSVPFGSGRVGSLKLRKLSYSARTRSAFGLARKKKAHLKRVPSAKGPFSGQAALPSPKSVVSALCWAGTQLDIWVEFMQFSSCVAIRSTMVIVHHMLISRRRQTRSAGRPGDNGRAAVTRLSRPRRRRRSEIQQDATVEIQVLALHRGWTEFPSAIGWTWRGVVTWYRNRIGDCRTRD